jgi:hypothetical protein
VAASEAGRVALGLVCCSLQDELRSIYKSLCAIFYAVRLPAAKVRAWRADALLKANFSQRGDHGLYLS